MVYEYYVKERYSVLNSYGILPYVFFFYSNCMPRHRFIKSWTGSKYNETDVYKGENQLGVDKQSTNKKFLI